jgi:hypothetical protein
VEKFQRSALKTPLTAKDKQLQGDVRRIMKYDVTTFNFLYGFFTESDKSQMVD